LPVGNRFFAVQERGVRLILPAEGYDFLLFDDEFVLNGAADPDFVQ